MVSAQKLSEIAVVSNKSFFGALSYACRVRVYEVQN